MHKLDAETKYRLREIVHLIAEGKSKEEAARSSNLDLRVVEELIALPQFEKELKTLNPEAHALWEESQKREAVLRAVKNEARHDGPLFYQELRKIALSTDIDKNTRANILEKLLKLGDYFKQDQAAETVTLSPSQIDTIIKATQEMDA